MAASAIKWIILLLASATLLIGCSGDDLAQTKAFVAEVKQRPGPPIEPLPEVKPYQAFVYAGVNIRSPFKPPAPPKLENIPLVNGISPDLNRPREILEFFPMDSLEVVGTLYIDNTMWGIIKDKDGLVHRVREGNFMGHNHGKVIKIDDNSVAVREIITDSRGGWEERDVTLNIGE